MSGFLLCWHRDGGQLDDAVLSRVVARLTPRGPEGARVRRSAPDGARDLRTSKLFTALWGLVAVGFANFASMVDNLIQAVNIIGSIFYGTVLGLFMVAFFLKKVGATPVFVAALIAQSTVLGLYFGSELGFLWYNVIGCGLVMSLAWVFEQLRPSAPRTAAAT